MRVLLLAVLFVNILFAKGFSIKEVDNLYEVIDKIKLSYQQDTVISRSYTPIHINEFEFDVSRDQISSIYDSNNTLLFYLVHNKVQNDPTKSPVLNLDLFNELTDYGCDYVGGAPVCSAQEYYESVLYDSSTVATWIFLKKYPTDKNIVLIQRENVRRNYTGSTNPNYNNSPTPMQGRNYFKVFIGIDGKPTIEFALWNGNYIHLKTPLPIPLNKYVYIQANNYGLDYEIGWKTLDNESSVIKGGHQYITMPPDIEKHKRILSVKNRGEKPIGVIEVGIKKAFYDNYQYYSNMFRVGIFKDFFWSYRLNMFEKMNLKNMQQKLIYQSNYFNLDVELVNKIITDISQMTNYFPPHTLRLFVNDANRILAVDIRDNF